MTSADFFIISGTSGSGKTIALQVLEDLGYYCIDNLPASLMPDLAAQLPKSDHSINNSTKKSAQNYAVSIDSRNRDFIGNFKDTFENLRVLNVSYKVIFLDADNDTLLKRFSETRRKHPLSNKATSLPEAIEKERQLLDHLREIADHRVNSSKYTPHELRSVIRNFASVSSDHSLTLLLQSFGFKYGSPTDADFVFDARCLPNPHWDEKLNPLTGLDAPVADFLNAQPLYNDMFEQLKTFIDYWLPHFIQNNRSYVTVAIGCTGGQHRSVYLSHQLKEYFATHSDIQVLLRHRELNI